MHVIRKFAYALLVALACAAPLVGSAEEMGNAPHRFADGSLVPSEADFVAAKPPDVMTMMPPYPAELIRANIQGHFEADLTVSEAGEVVKIEVVHSAGALLNRVARKHARKFRFSPALLDGKPVASIHRVIFDWYLGEDEPH